MNICPICLDQNNDLKSISENEHGFFIDCIMCGRYVIEHDAWDKILDPQTGRGHTLSEICRTRLSHRVLTMNRNSKDTIVTIMSEMVEAFISSGCPGPNPAEQSTNLIQFIGDAINLTGKTIFQLPKNIHLIIGATEPQMCANIINELIDKGLIIGRVRGLSSGGFVANAVNLSLDGWNIYESAKDGKFSGKFGFLALQFGDSALDNFVKTVIKPCIKDDLGLDLFDMRDVAQAGIIDNIMRAQIRDSAFVIVDLTHDNSGAYWEAGYAEGLGKPVIYICERSKFDEAQTHFDTNHCTTVIWSANEPDKFQAELVATIRRSLDIFD